MLHRRKFLVGLLAAPAIVHAGNLMPIRALRPEEELFYYWKRIDGSGVLYACHPSYPGKGFWEISRAPL